MIIQGLAGATSLYSTLTKSVSQRQEAPTSTAKFADTVTISDAAKALAAGDNEATQSKPDFEHMTRKELADWMNGELKSGRMSFDDSSAFLGMTMKIPVNTGPINSASLDNQEQLNFVQKAKDGLVWAEQNNDQATRTMLLKALNIMGA